MVGRARVLSVDAEYYESTVVPALFRELAARLVQLADPAPGQAVLDVGCGTGIVARTVADRIGGRDNVIGVDINESMLAVARRLRPELGWRQADAGALPLEDDSFDLVCCQAALMYFPDRVAALREMERVVRPAGRVVVVVPGRLRESPGYLALVEGAGRYARWEVLDRIGSYFAVGEPGLLAELFVAAGLELDWMRTWRAATRLDSVDAFINAQLLPLAGVIDARARSSIAREWRGALAEFVDRSGAIAAPLEVHLIVARRSTDPCWR